MKNKLIKFIAIQFSSFIIITLHTKSVNAQESPYKIVNIKAYLYFENKGTFSENILDNPNFILWNTIIGEGSAKSSSNSTMVVIEINGNPLKHISQRIEFVAMENNKVKIKQILDFTINDNNDKYFAVFWLYNTGCNPIKISAKILGQKDDNKIETTIPFQCGE